MDVASLAGRSYSPSPPSSTANPERRELLLQLYPSYVTVGEYAATPRPVHRRQWIRDGEVTQCAGCGEEFTFVIRKHHCRICGNIFCHPCSAQCLSLWQEDGQVHDVRTCDHCHADYQQPIVKTHTEQVVGLSPMKRSSFHRLDEDDLARIAGFLAPPALLHGLGSTCRHLYFRARDNIVWLQFPHYGAVVGDRGASPLAGRAARAAAAASRSGASTPNIFGGATLPGHSPASTYHGPTSNASNASSHSGGATSPRAQHASGDVSPVSLDALLVSSAGKDHPMAGYHAWRRQLDAKRQKLFKVQRRRLVDILSNPLKVGIVGPPGVGKTALVNHFEHYTPYPCGRGHETPGGRMRQVKFDVSSIGSCNSRYEGVSGVSPSFMLVDCGGDARYRALLPHYLSGVHVAIVCVAAMRDVAEQVSLIAPMCSAGVTIIACLLRQQGDQDDPCRPIPRGSDDPRVAVCTEADPFTGRGVVDVFRMCVQLYLDQHVLHAADVCNPKHDRRVGPTPLELLLGLAKP